MLIRELITSEMSGSMGGITAARNRGGPYLRARVTPIDPATARQLVCRDAIAAAYAEWAGMDDAYRQAWQTWADALPRTNRIGDKRHNSGWAEYSRWCVLRKQINAQLGFVLGTGSATPKFPEAAVNYPLSAELVGEGGTFRLHYSPDDWWTADQDNCLALFLCSTREDVGGRAIRPIRGTINFFKGPYELATAVAGDPDGPLSGELDFNLPVAATAGQRVFWRARLSTDDHGTSREYSGVVIAT
jgi:hypothetical protein